MSTIEKLFGSNAQAYTESGGYEQKTELLRCISAGDTECVEEVTVLYLSHLRDMVQDERESEAESENRERMRLLLCKFKRLIYQASPDAYTVALYKPCESVLDSSGRRISEVKAVGWCLPTAEKLKYDLKGHWSKTAKHGMQFEVETYDEVIEPTREDIIS